MPSATARWKAMRGALNARRAARQGLRRRADCGQVEAALESAFDIRFVFNKWTLGEKFCSEMLKLDAAAMDAPDFDMLKTLGFSQGRDRRRPTCMSAAR